MSEADNLLRAADEELEKADTLMRRVHNSYKRRPQEPIIDITQDRRESFCLKVAAEYLGMDTRSLRARVDDGRLPAIEDGRIVKIQKADLIAYEASRRARRAS